MRKAALHFANVNRLAIDPELIAFFDSVQTALIFSQMMFHSSHSNHAGGAFYNTDKDYAQQFKLSVRQFRHARDKLVKLGYVQTKIKLKTNTCLKTTWYLINLDKFFDDFEAHLNQSENMRKLRESIELSTGECPFEATESVEVTSVSLPNDMGVSLEMTSVSDDHTERSTERSTDKDHMSANANNREKNAEVEQDETQTEKAFYFEQLWKRWHNKVKKQAAVKAFDKFVNRNTTKDLHVLVNTLAHDIKRRYQVRQFEFENMHFSTYLNEQRWLDDVKPGKWSTD